MCVDIVREWGLRDISTLGLRSSRDPRPLQTDWRGHPVTWGGVLEICISSLDHGLQGEGDRDALTPLEPLHETKRNEIRPNVGTSWGPSKCRSHPNFEFHEAPCICNTAKRGCQPSVHQQQVGEARTLLTVCAAARASLGACPGSIPVARACSNKHNARQSGGRCAGKIPVK